MQICLSRFELRFEPGSNHVNCIGFSMQLRLSRCECIGFFHLYKSELRGKPGPNVWAAFDEAVTLFSQRGFVCPVLSPAVGL